MLNISSTHDAFRVGDITRVILPYPPTANHIWKNGGGRVYKSKQYRLFESQAAACVFKAKVDFIDGPYGMAIEAIPPDRRKRDISNLIKPIEDVLNGVLVEDDSLCQVITACWASGVTPSKDEARVCVAVVPMEKAVA